MSFEFPVLLLVCTVHPVPEVQTPFSCGVRPDDRLATNDPLLTAKSKVHDQDCGGAVGVMLGVMVAIAV
jgi:hypothetical protein